MDTQQLLREFKGFIDSQEKSIIKQLSNDGDSITIDLNELLEYDYTLYDTFIRGGEDIYGLLKAVTANEYGNVELLFKNAPESENVVINNIRTEDIGRFVTIKGMVKRKSDIHPKLTKTYYLCTNPSCNYSQDYIELPQVEDEEKMLKSCPKCKSAVQKEKEDKVNFQTIMVEEMSEDLENSSIQPKSKVVHLEGVLTTPERDNNIIVGSKIEVIGYIREKKKKTQNKYSVKSDFYIQAYNLNLLEEKLYDINLSQDEIEDFYYISGQEDIIDTLVGSFAPHLYGMHKEKLASLLSIVGGTEGTRRRNNIHILYVGDPGKGKSKILHYVKELMPRSKYVSGEGSSGVGITASAVKDEMTGHWMAEAGAAVLANKGYLLVDELDKIHREYQTNLNTPLESGKVTIDKAGINAEINAEITGIACANPKSGKFDRNQDISKQIQIDSSLRSRFDLLFVLFDEQDEQEDDAIADSIFEDIGEKVWDIDRLRKYLILAKQKSPKHTDKTKKVLKEYYKKIRRKSNDKDITMSVRQLEGLVRLSEAYAKLHLRNEVYVEDCYAVIDIMEYCHKNYGVSDYMTGVSNRTRSKTQVLNKLLEQFELEQDKEFTIDELDKQTSKDISVSDIENYINDMRLQGYIFEPRKNIYMLVK